MMVVLAAFTLLRTHKEGQSAKIICGTWFGGVQVDRLPAVEADRVAAALAVRKLVKCADPPPVSNRRQVGRERLQSTDCCRCWCESCQ